MQAGGQAITGDHIEAHTGADHHAQFARLLVTLVSRFEHADLAGDIDVVGGAGQAGFQHRCAGGGKRPCAVGNHGDIRQRFLGTIQLLDIEYPAFQAEQAAQGVHRSRVTSGENGREALALGFGCDQMAGVAVGAVNHPVRRHPMLLGCYQVCAWQLSRCGRRCCLSQGVCGR